MPAPIARGKKGTQRRSSFLQGNHCVPFLPVSARGDLAIVVDATAARLLAPPTRRIRSAEWASRGKGSDVCPSRRAGARRRRCAGVPLVFGHASHSASARTRRRSGAAEERRKHWRRSISVTASQHQWSSASRRPGATGRPIATSADFWPECCDFAAQVPAGPGVEKASPGEGGRAGRGRSISPIVRRARPPALQPAAWAKLSSALHTSPPATTMHEQR